MTFTEKHLDQLADLQAQMGRQVNFEEIAQTLFESLPHLFPCDRLGMAFLHEDGKTLVYGPALTRRNRKIFLSTGFREILPARIARSLFKNRMGRIQDLEKAHETPETPTSISLLIKEGLRSRLTVPFFFKGKPGGLLFVCARERNGYKAVHKTLLRIVAGELALILEHGRLSSRVSVGQNLKERLRNENLQLREAYARPPELGPLLGESIAWRKMLHKVQMVAHTEATVLVRGETGTGKELIARALHNLSPRNKKPFVAINCGALSPNLIESELFGHELGAFTGAVKRRLGRLDMARGGTLFLDEVAELSAATQVKLLRLLQEREYERVGGTVSLRADVRLIAATHRDLKREMAEGRFREDLFFRLNVFPIFIPPLRERLEDLEPLLQHFLNKYVKKARQGISGIDPLTVARCQQYHWPGNVRELENLVERAVILNPGKLLYLDPLSEAESLTQPFSRPLAFDDVVRDHLRTVLNMSRGKIYGHGGAAKILNLKPSTLQAKLKKYGLERRDFPDTSTTLEVK